MLKKKPDHLARSIATHNFRTLK